MSSKIDKNIALKITDLGKKYSLNDKLIGVSFRERFSELLSLSSKRKNNEEFWALKNINLEIKKGESIGLIGKNGSGKSTLLKLISQVITPTEGQIIINGSVAAVLELGMGFHPDLTGRENIYQNSAILGFSKIHINQIFNDIVDFADIGRFIDQPVKNYSSGMYQRLSFSIVAHLDTDIMLFDETLSTGDLSFQQKCYEKIDDLVAKGKTLIVVSHNMNDIIRIAKRIIYIDNGKIKSDSSSESLNEYVKDNISQTSLFQKKNIKNKKTNNSDTKLLFAESGFTRESYNNVSINMISISIVNKNSTNETKCFTNDELEISIEFEKKQAGTFFDIGIMIHHMNNMILYAHTLNSDLDIKEISTVGFYTIKTYIPAGFLNSISCQIGLSVSENYTNVIFANKNLLNINLLKNPKFESKIKHIQNPLPSFIGPIFPVWDWKYSKHE
ncbi:MAG: ABC transporter ATP-binding protein [Bacteroidales bacterium]|nr:ABC transporter ATP-binding protein [Bacteroidales bacterium]